MDILRAVGINKKLMKTITLKLYLMTLIFLIANACFLATAAFVLYQTHDRFLHETTISAESIDKQLEVQLIFGTAKNTSLSSFSPDFNFWAKSKYSSGLCVHFERPKGNVIKRACRGAKIKEHWPGWFEKTYYWFFQPSHEIRRPITFRDKVYGFITVSSNVETELGHAWHDAKTMMKLSGITIISLCTLLFFAVGWALRPAQKIVIGLEKMTQGNLSTRLDNFTITEWQRTGLAINQLTENLQKTLSDRNKLALKLVNTQEQERRHLTRELHDEFGQSLAGLAAIASSITQTAEKQCPQLVTESKSIGRISTHMMELLRGMLIRLRPTSFDELGLTESLHRMIVEWNSQSVGKTSFKLDIVGNFEQVSDDISINIFRIIQECLTNISKHSKAKNASVKLEISSSKECILLTIEDNGVADNTEFSDFSGIGLLGMRERVSQLEGRLVFDVNKPRGLIVHIRIPLQPITESQA